MPDQTKVFLPAGEPVILNEPVEKVQKAIGLAISGGGGQLLAFDGVYDKTVYIAAHQVLYVQAE